MRRRQRSANGDALTGILSTAATATAGATLRDRPQPPARGFWSQLFAAADAPVGTLDEQPACDARAPFVRR